MSKSCRYSPADKISDQNSNKLVAFNSKTETITNSIQSILKFIATEIYFNEIINFLLL